MNIQQQIITRFLLAPQANYDQSHTLRVRQYNQENRPLKPAAVLIPLVPRHGSFSMIFTRRAEHLKHHPGQVSFPGGRYEPQDIDLIDTALRETQEETGILCNRDSIIGQLPSLPTISGYIVTPYLSVIAPDYRPHLDPNEVDELFEAPIEHVLNPMNIRIQKVTLRGKNHNIYSIPFSKYSIWGATAQMLKLLSDQLWYEKI
ncbi:CoA pyrophosphatase [Photobacterium lutimaris]|uniref:CoA pyrophosphatase n=1 Tax=Photobacterium lutimaris TaxID=388278 RepID=A0A2T3J230_9GAMM|nr:CoA pyrophosphatase [Photobacterium lutimaris]PSU35136.1 CoA pyrophosphatase [Photobacterium lutimaris]TDR77498.1 8-oxo-dGTP pyrophosphatase MutT (NUDIX family) [Photobacterium lutimaris]